MTKWLVFQPVRSVINLTFGALFFLPGWTLLCNFLIALYQGRGMQRARMLGDLGSTPPLLPPQLAVANPLWVHITKQQSPGLGCSLAFYTPIPANYTTHSWGITLLSECPSWPSRLRYPGHVQRMYFPVGKQHIYNISGLTSLHISHFLYFSGLYNYFMKSSNIKIILIMDLPDKYDLFYWLCINACFPFFVVSKNILIGLTGNTG